MMNQSISVREAAAGLQEKWSPRVIAEVDDVYVKVAKVYGQLAWHSHENEDEFYRTNPLPNWNSASRPERSMSPALNLPQERT
jgi:hypothetical protein